MGKKKKEEMYVCAFVILLESLKESLENNFPRPKKKRKSHMHNKGRQKSEA